MQIKCVCKQTNTHTWLFAITSIAKKDDCGNPPCKYLQGTIKIIVHVWVDVYVDDRDKYVL